MRVTFTVEFTGAKAFVLGNGVRWFETTPRRAVLVVSGLNTGEAQDALAEAMRTYRGDGPGAQ